MTTIRELRLAAIGAIAGIALAPAACAQAGAPESSPQTRAPEPAATPPAGEVARFQLTRAVDEREPVDSIDQLSNDQRLVFFFTELRNFEGHTLTHRWEYNRQVMGEVPFEVGGPRWRVWSSKNLEPIWLGEWRVSVVDEAGAVVASKTFTYSEAAAAEPVPAPASPAASDVEEP